MIVSQIECLYKYALKRAEAERDRTPGNGASFRAYKESLYERVSG